MILIIGGAYQGKFEYAKANFKEGHQIINNFHKYVRKTMQQGKDPELEAKQLMNKAVLAGNADKLVLVSDEVGSGIVPIDAFEREFREKNGRVNCYLASQAEQVIRVTAGIGTRIKGYESKDCINPSWHDAGKSRTSVCRYDG